MWLNVKFGKAVLSITLVSRLPRYIKGSRPCYAQPSPMELPQDSGAMCCARGQDSSGEGGFSWASFFFFLEGHLHPPPTGSGTPGLPLSVSSS